MAKNFFLRPLFQVNFLCLFLLWSCQPPEVETFTLKINSISPDQGVTEGGERITFKGEGLNNLKSIKIGEDLCSDLKIISDSEASCVTLPQEVGEVKVVLTNIIDQTAEANFNYIYAPVIKNILPSSGPLSASTSVTITGSGFDEDGVSVTFGGEECGNITVEDSTQITCTVPPGSKVGLVQTVVTNNASGKKVSETLFNYRNKPTLSQISPAGGSSAGGTLVTISGTSFSSDIEVTIGGLPCLPLTVLGSGSLTCRTPASSSLGAKNVVAKFSDNLKSTEIKTYTYRVAPTVSGFPLVNTLPTSTPNDQEFTVVIFGTGFISGAVARIGGVQCLMTTFNSPNWLNCKIKGGLSGAHKVTVINPDLQIGTSVLDFTFKPNPTINSVKPVVLKQTGGEEVTIVGANFDTNATVKIGNSTCTPLSRTSTEIKCTTQNTLVHGNRSLVVSNQVIQGYTPQASSPVVVLATPTISTISPNSGKVSGGTLVTITGENFSAAGMKITFDGNQCNIVPPVVINASGADNVNCMTPFASSPRVVLVEIEDELSQRSPSALEFTYKNGPEITSLSPNKGRATSMAPLQKVLVTIMGENFENGATVKIDGVLCEDPEILSDSEMKCTVPDSTNGKLGEVDVEITNKDGQSDMLQNGYTYQNIILDWNLSEYDFLEQSLSKIISFTLTNSENSKDTLLSTNRNITLVSDTPAAWTYDISGCSGDILVGGSCTVTVTFKADDPTLPTGVPLSAELKVETVSDPKTSASTQISGTVSP